MTTFYVLSGLLGLGLSVFLFKRDGESRERLMGGVLAALSVGLLAYAILSGIYSPANQYASVLRERGYALGIGLGEYLKQTHPNQKILILKTESLFLRESQIIEGLEKSAADTLTIVGSRAVKAPESLADQSKLFDAAFLAELKKSGAQIVVSFVGIPLRVDAGGSLDMQATSALWQSPDAQGLQWVLPTPSDVLPPGSFAQGHLIVAAWEKPPSGKPGNSSDNAKTDGSPEQQFQAWYELQTQDEPQ